MILQVRPENLARLAALASLSESAFAELRTMLETKTQVLDGPGPMRKVMRELRICPPEVASQVVEAVMPLFLGHVVEGKEPGEVVDGVIEGIQEHYDRKVLLKAKELTLLRARLKQLLESDRLALKAKATSLVFDRGLLLSEAKVVTDLRPIFAMRSQDKVEAMTVIHTLVLECYEDGESHRYHIGVDLEDLASLKAMAERALAKDKALSKFIGDSGTTKMEVD